jgi:Tfp pilus assembly protein PilV
MRHAKAAFSVLEIMVAVALLAIIIVGLLAMFYQVQRAFRAGTAQVDVMEGGRAAITLLMREMQEATATGLLEVTNLAIVPSWQEVQTSQTLSSGNVQQNFLSDLCFIQRRNDEWTGIAYRLTNAASGVGTLVRYSWSWTNISNPLWMDETNRMMSRAVCTWPPDRYDGESQIVDGVVHFQVEAYDAEGVMYRPPVYPDINDSYLRRDNDVQAFMSTNLPAYLDVELRVLEPATLARFRVREQANPAEGLNYLARQIGRTHVFRQRIPVRTAALHAF